MSRIGVDVRGLETGHRFRGIGVYAQAIIKELSWLDHRNEYVFLKQSTAPINKFILDSQFLWQQHIVGRRKDASRYNWWLDQIDLPLAIKHSRLDLIHFLDQLSAPLVKVAKTIITVHDLMQIQQVKATVFKNQIKILPVHYADKIITISEATKKSIIDNLKIPEEKIRVIYNGYDVDNFKPINDKREIRHWRQKFLREPSRHYFLYIGSYGDYDPRKNIDFLLDTFAALARQEKNIALVFIGKTGSESARLLRVARRRGLRDKIVFTGFIEVRDLVTAINGAEAFLFPSLCEGFGLPVLEAMACGIPVLAADRSSLPEVIKNAGILLDPCEKLDWVRAMKNILRNKHLKNTLSQRGLRRVKQFSWAKCIKETVTVYNEVLNEDRH